jgi:hypothetical protein
MVSHTRASQNITSTNTPSGSTVLYVIILSAALDLVPPSTPKGIIAFCNIAPALVNQIINISREDSVLSYRILLFPR